MFHAYVNVTLYSVDAGRILCVAYYGQYTGLLQPPGLM